MQVPRGWAQYWLSDKNDDLSFFLVWNRVLLTGAAVPVFFFFFF